MLEMKTAFFFLGFAGMVFAVLLLLTDAKSTSKRIITLLAWAKLAQAVAFFLFSGRGAIPDVLSQNAGSALLITGFSMEAAAVWLFVGRARWKAIVLPVPLIFLLVVNSGVMTRAPEAMKAALASFVLAFLMVLCSLAFLRGQSNRSSLALTIGVMDAITALVNIAGGTTAFPMLAFGLLSPAFVQHLTIGALFLFLCTNGFGFLLLIKEEDDRALSRERQRHKQILDAFPCGICTVDRTYSIEYINPILIRLFGEPGDQKCFEYFHSLQEPCSWCRNEMVFQGQTVHRNWHSPLNEHYYELVDLPVYNEDGTISKLEVFNDVTERKRAEEALLEREARFRFTLQNAGTVVFTQDKELVYTEVLTWNPHLPKEMMLGKKDGDLFSGEDVERLANIKRTVLETGKPACEEVTVTIGGDRRVYLLKVDPIRGKGEVEGICCAATDITRRRRAERELRENEERFRALFDNSLDGMFLSSPDGSVYAANRTACEILGWSEEEICQMGRAGIIDSKDPRLPEALKMREFTGKFHGELNLKKKDGAVFPAELTASCFTLENGEMRSSIIFRDVTRRKLAEEALLESENKFKAFAEQAFTGQYLIQDGVLKYVNPKFAEIFGCTVAECLDMPFSNLVHPEDVPIVEEEVGQRVSGDIDTSRYTFRGLKKDGRIANVEIYGSRIVHKGRPAALGTILDVTDRMRAERDLLRQHELQRVLLSTIPACVYVKDRDSVYMTANKEFGALAGTPENEIPGKTDYDLFPKTVADKFRKTDSEVIRTGAARLNYEESGKDAGGSDVWFQTSKCPFYGYSGEIAGLVGISINTTDRKREEEECSRLQQRLQQVHKAESLGRMAGAIAHNFNNMLAAVLGNLELALEEAAAGSELRACIGEAMNASQRAANISRFMLTYLGQTTGKTEVLDPASLIKEACGLLSASLPQNVRLKVEIPSQRYSIKIDEVQLTQIVTNLMENSGEAIGEQEGEISLTIDAVPGASLRERKVFPLDWKPGAEDYVRISIADTGCGISPELLDDIFDPFFSTKFTGRGMGLAVVLGLLRSNDGGIAVESLPGRGTTFALFFPLLERPEPAASKEPASADRLAAGGLLVLVVDDEDVLRAMAQAMLTRKFGCEVITARDGFEAVAVFMERKEEIDLVLLDIGMPRMNGWETLSALRALRPDIRVIFSSGYDEDHLRKGNHQEKPQAFLAKPYGSNELRAAIEAALR